MFEDTHLLTLILVINILFSLLMIIVIILESIFLYFKSNAFDVFQNFLAYMKRMKDSFLKYLARRLSNKMKL